VRGYRRSQTWDRNGLEIDMPITITKSVVCDECGRSPNQDDPWDAVLYGWVQIIIEHLCTQPVGHNEIDFKPSSVLCAFCRRKFANELPT
jgi:hypothetical protein